MKGPALLGDASISDILAPDGRAGGPAVHVRSAGASIMTCPVFGGLASVVGDILRGIWVSMTGAAKVIGGMARAAPGDLAFLKGLIESGKLRTVIDRRYSLDEIAEAHRHAEAGHKKGHVVILLAQTSQ